MSDTRKKDISELSYHQQRMWFIEKFERGKLYTSSPIYHNIPILLQLVGEVDPEKIESALKSILEKHSVLRTKINEFEEYALQEVISMEEVDFQLGQRSLKVKAKSSGRSPYQLAVAYAARAAKIPFRFGRENFFRATLIRYTDNESLLLIVSHHCVIDRYSTKVLAREFGELYRQLLSGKSAPLEGSDIHYTDYVKWQNSLTDEEMEPLSLYWQSLLGQSIPFLQLPTLKPRPPIQVFKGRKICFSLTEDQVSKVNRFCDDSGLSLKGFFLAAYAHLLAIYSSDSDLIVGTYMDVRDEDLESLVAPLENLIPIRCCIPEFANVTEHLASIDSMLSQAWDYRQVPYEVLSHKFQHDNDMGRTALFDVLFHFDDKDGYQTDEGGCEIRSVETFQGYGKYDINLMLHKDRGRVSGAVFLNEDVFSADFSEQFKRHYLVLIDEYLNAPRSALGALQLLSKEEMQYQLDSLNGQRKPFSEQTNVVDILSQVNLQYADNVAVSCGKEHINYRDLNEKSNKIANYCLACGVHEFSVVGVALDPSIDLIATILAVIKIGATYLPLDHQLPIQRLQHFVRDSGASKIITTQSILENALSEVEATHILLDRDEALIESQENIFAPRSISPDQGLYIIYTSGSTGLPKGVLLSHRNMLRLFVADDGFFRFTSDDKWLLFHSFAFDFSVWEIFGALLHGGTLVVADREQRKDYNQVSKLIVKESVTILNQTPPSFKILSEYLMKYPQEDIQLRKIIFGGGALYKETITQWMKHFPFAKLINMYGITETCVHVTYHEVSEDDFEFNSYIGAPIPATQLYILDEHMRLLPKGVIGELYVGGEGLALQYLNRQQLTAEKFVPNPFSDVPGARLYRSGDLAKYGEDGTVIYIGRRDGQVKIRGFRIELGEIENALLADERVNNCALDIYQTKDGEKNIAAYVELNQHFESESVAEADTALLENKMPVTADVEAVADDARENSLDNWRSVFESYYDNSRDDVPQDFDISGWLSSYTNLEIDKVEMADWVRATIEAIDRYKPKHVLEIGCGTGLLLSRIAPLCSVYDATDFSATAIEKINHLKNSAQELSHVRSFCITAEETPPTGIKYDTIIINSVVQYFPSAQYLKTVIENAISLVKEGGRIFIGDVRNLLLLKAFHTSTLLYRNQEDLPKSDFDYLVSHAVKSDTELVLAPAFFSDIEQADCRINRTEILTKVSQYENEMSLFRYDAVLHVGSQAIAGAQKPEWIEWSKEWGLDKIKSALSDCEGGYLALRNVVNKQLSKESVSQFWLDDGTDIRTSASFKNYLTQSDDVGIGTYELSRLAQECKFNATIWESADGGGWKYDVLLSAEGFSEFSNYTGRQFEVAVEGIEQERDSQRLFLHSNPVVAAEYRNCGLNLKQSLVERIPAYAVPEKILVVDRLPLTNNQKVDFKKLPNPNILHNTAEVFIAAQTVVQQKLEGIWKSLLGMDNISINEDFFAIGGHSLLATRLVHRVYEEFSFELPLRAIFESPTIEGLSIVIEKALENQGGVKSEQNGLVQEQELSEKQYIGPATSLASFSQARFWFLSKLSESQQAYHVPMVLKLEGHFDYATLEKSFAYLSERHQALRTCFYSEGEDIYQKIYPTQDVPIDFISVDNRNDDESSASIKELIDRELDVIFDLEEGPLYKISVIKYSEDVHYLVLLMHHIITDSWSLNILFSELFTIYEDIQTQVPPRLQALTVEYSDYVKRQREILEAEESSAHKNYWLKELNNPPQALSLGDKSHSSTDTENCSKTHTLSLPSSNLKQLAKDAGVTLYSVMLAAFYTVLSKYSGTSDIVIGTPIANRASPKSAKLVGLLVNNLPLRINVKEPQTLDSLIQIVNRCTKEMHFNQDVPLEWIMENLFADGDKQRPALYKTMFVLQNVPHIEVPKEDLTIEQMSVETKAPKLDLMLAVSEYEDKLLCGFEYNDALFSDTYIKQFAKHFQSVLESMSRDLNQSFDSLTLADERDESRYSSVLNCAEKLDRRFVSAIEQFETKAQETPQSVALTFEDHHLSFAELNIKANQFARYLQQNGVTRGSVVAISMLRSMEMITSILAVMKVGAAYLPLDPETPLVRKQHILKSSKAVMLIIQASSIDNSDFSRDDEIQVVCLAYDASSSEYTSFEESNLSVALSPKDLAYVIYTSGSTGMPKGVMSTHMGLQNRLEWMMQEYDVSKADNILFKTPYIFDVSVWEIILPLISGARLVVAKPDLEKDPAGIGKLIQDEQVTLVHFIPSVLSVFCQLSDLRTCPSLRHVICSGEALPMSLVEKCLGKNETSLHNLYGPTEASIDVSAWACAESDLPVAPLGKPISNISFEILLNNQRAPVGAVGELFIAGDGLASGYIGDPRQTAEKFLPNPYSEKPGERFYASGDLVRINEKQELEYLGRCDQQVKVRGMRIELGEIEQVLIQDASVSAVVVVCNESDELIAGVVCQEQKLNETFAYERALLESAAQSLPPHMLPKQVVLIDEIPRLPSGKVNRKEALALLNKLCNKKSVFETASLSEIENDISAIWSKILKHNDFSFSDNFFDVGGNSILAALIHAELAKKYDSSLSIVDLFQYTSIRAMAGYLSGGNDNAVQAGANNTPVSHGLNTDIAIVGMSSRISDCENYQAFWQEVLDGKEFIRELSEEELLQAGVQKELLNDDRYVRFANTVRDCDKFDPEFFNMLPSEASTSDPQYRVLLECVYDALEDAAYVADKDLKVGAFVGVGSNVYGLERLISNQKAAQDFSYYLNNSPGFVATKIAYQLDLKGPAITIDTACSTFLTGIHTAKASLLSGDCNLAVVAAARINNLYGTGYQYTEGGVNSRDGHCRPFDNSANGTVSADGGGAVVLQRLDDAIAQGSHIHAVIKGSAINNDGRSKVGYTAPSIQGQSRVIKDAISDAGVEKESIAYIEAHGTGTIVGDPIEINALKSVYIGKQGQDKPFVPESVKIGSVKSNLGHLDVAAGLASMIKAVGVVKGGVVPPTIHFDSLNVDIDLEGTPFSINSGRVEISNDHSPRRAGISSFGIGGTNAHLVIEQAEPYKAKPSKQKQHVIVLSAKSIQALRERINDLINHLEQSEFSLADIAYTLQVGREHFSQRCALQCVSKEDLYKQCQDILAQWPKVGDQIPKGLNINDHHPFGESINTHGINGASFLFPGQGEDYVNMFLTQYKNEPVFKEVLNQCREIVLKLEGYDICDLLYPESEDNHLLGDGSANLQRFASTAQVHPILFAVEYSLAQLWMSWGVMPNALLGHSLGEYVAATVANIFSLEDALYLVIQRGKLLENIAPGQMMAIFSPREEVEEMLNEEISVAAVNSENIVVVSGANAAVECLKNSLQERGTKFKLLSATGAFHSPLVTPVLAEYRVHFDKISLNTPRLPIVSSVTGEWMTDAQATSPEYWLRQLRDCVEFSKAIKTLMADEKCLALEVGPNNTLASIAELNQLDRQRVQSSDSHKDSRCCLLTRALVSMWAVGLNVSWSKLQKDTAVQRVPLPTYPYQRERYWLEVEKNTLPLAMKRETIENWVYEPGWKRKNLYPKADNSVFDESYFWFVFADEGVHSEALVNKLSEKKQRFVTVTSGSQYTSNSGATHTAYTLSPDSWQDYNLLFSDIDIGDCSKVRVIHAWLLERENTSIPNIDNARYQLDKGMQSLIKISQELEIQYKGVPVDLLVVSNEVQRVMGEEKLSPEKSAVLGCCKVLPQEIVGFSSSSIDIDPALYDSPLTDTIFKEFAAGLPDTYVAIRSGQRWIRDYQVVALPTMNDLTDQDQSDDKAKIITDVTPGRAILISGGLGGIGIEFAKAYAQAGVSKLILLGRSHLPAREEWSAFCEAPENEPRKKEGIEAVKYIESLGTEVVYLSVDISNYDVLYNKLADYLDEIEGVIHAAGNYSVGLTKMKSKEMIETVISPKVIGLRNFEKLFANHSPAFVALFSSLATVVGGMGQVDYCAANNVLDSFAISNHFSDKTEIVAINWDTWLDTGMALSSGLHTMHSESGDPQLELAGIHNQEGLDVFSVVLGAGINQAIVSSVSLEQRLAESELLKGIDESVLEISGVADKALIDIDNMSLEELVTAIWSNILGHKDIAPEDDFFALGGTSLLGISLVNSLQEAIGEIVHISIIFEAPTIEKMVEYIRENYMKDDKSYSRAALSNKDIAQFRQIMNMQRSVEKGGKNEKAIFILSAPRCGSTLLRVMLAGHSHLTSPPELSLLSFDRLRDISPTGADQELIGFEACLELIMHLKQCELVEAKAVLAEHIQNDMTSLDFYAQLQSWCGDKVLVDKSPNYSYNLSTLENIEENFDDAFYIHLVRNPFGMILSYDEAKMDLLLDREVRNKMDFSRNELAELIWLNSNRNIYDFLHNVDSKRQILVCYEELVKNPEKVMRELSDKMGVSFEQGMLAPYDASDAKMTSGTSEESRMIGDVKFHSHGKIDHEMASRWETIYKKNFLSEQTMLLANTMGYKNLALVEDMQDPMLTQSNRQKLQYQLASVDDLSHVELDYLLSNMES